MLTAHRRLTGHSVIGPNEVFDQLKAAMRLPSSPPPARNAGTVSGKGGVFAKCAAQRDDATNSTEHTAFREVRLADELAAYSQRAFASGPTRSAHNDLEMKLRRRTVQCARYCAAAGMQGLGDCLRRNAGPAGQRGVDQGELAMRQLLR